MSQQELLKRVVTVLDEAGLEYMITGSVASSLQGEPRSTHDIDLVADIPRAAVKKLIEAFPSPLFYLDEGGIMKAISTKGMFNLLDVDSGDKVDFWILTDEPFDRSRFARRKMERVMGIEIMVSSPEDTILAKLRWAKLSGGSEKHFFDALRVYEVQYGNLNLEYLHKWVKKLKVEKLFTRLQQEAVVI